MLLFFRIIGWITLHILKSRIQQPHGEVLNSGILTWKFQNECYPKKVTCKIFNIFAWSSYKSTQINPTKPSYDSKKGCGVVSASTENDMKQEHSCVLMALSHTKREEMLPYEFRDSDIFSPSWTIAPSKRACDPLSWACQIRTPRPDSNSFPLLTNFYFLMRSMACYWNEGEEKK